MWQSLSFKANYKAAYCLAVCPAGEDVIEPYLDDRKEFMDRVLKPLQDKRETLYVLPNSAAKAHAEKRYPHKTVKVVDSGIRRPLTGRWNHRERNARPVVPSTAKVARRWRHGRVSFRLWAFGDAHVGTDRQFGRESLAEAIRQSEFGGAQGGPSFGWDIAVGRRRHVRRASQPARRRRRAGGPPAALRCCASTGVKTSTRCAETTTAVDFPSPTPGGGRSGSIRWACTPNIPGSTPQLGRYQVTRDLGTLLVPGGQPALPDAQRPQRAVADRSAGARWAATPAGWSPPRRFEWWANMVEQNRDSIIITVHHYVLKDTTVASGEWEGCAAARTENSTSTTIARSWKGRRRARPTCTGSAASRTPEPSSGTSPSTRVRSRSGWPGTPTPIPTIPTAARLISNRLGVEPIS